MAFSLKEEAADWRAKALAVAHRRIEDQNIREANELQRLRALRLQTEAQAQRELWRQQEIQKIAESRNIIDREKREKRAATVKKIGSAVGFVRKALAANRPTGSPRDDRTRLSLFNPPNIWTGKRVKG